MCEPGDIVKYIHPVICLNKWNDNYVIDTKLIDGKIYVDSYDYHPLTYIGENELLLYLGKEKRADKETTIEYYIYKFLCGPSTCKEIFFFAAKDETNFKKYFIKEEEE